MTPEQFFHVCRSAAVIANRQEVTVFGSAAVIPWIARDRPSAPWWASIEVDVDPGGEALATLVDGSIGEGSLFEETFGIRGHGVTLDAFVAPADWPQRAAIFADPGSLVRVRAPSPRDLSVAKLVRGDERDIAFARFCVEHFEVTLRSLEEGLRGAAIARPTYVAAIERAIGSLAPNLA